MHFSSAITGLAILAGVSALDNVASFESYDNDNCSPPAQQNQNINSDICTFLPGQTAKIFFLEKTRANCKLYVYTNGDCTGTAEPIVTSAPSSCLNVATKFGYKVLCT
ncbi:hypothetical protein EJ02DRAFT_422556 [Clathrospora elynae]|uniref:Uncharacterized protein n=1 Tax=Clathrospora elynae TaxID=706981 RepID=A0A6A5SQM4_9PLEO|nr:hypothetical protein EJ02DRAFT_422556 [Clathrospora elynae]